MPERREVRCAVYTRKSSEDGLEQSFNSLDAQREACLAFIASQKHEGWRAVPAYYDDGGYSGGNTARPGLARLLDDIKAKRVDCIVVYKVDRLTRSLADFAKIVEVLDGQGASFVSITQQFNTASSMGRLTLNVLLSFAQFEREIAGERIRDKIRASRQKGMWMGGAVPLGYEVKDKQLKVAPAEAKRVQSVFSLYAELGSVAALKLELDRRGVVSKERQLKSGATSGGTSMSWGMLYSMLSNRTYIGLAVHKGKAYPGRHEAVVGKDLWDRVQQTLELNRVSRKTRETAANPSLLSGLLFDASGERLTPSHANKGGKRYRYYVSRSLLTRPSKASASSTVRIAASEIEGVVIDGLQYWLSDERELLDVLRLTESGTDVIRGVVDRAKMLATQLGGPALPKSREFVRAVVKKVVIESATLSMTLDVRSLSRTIFQDGVAPDSGVTRRHEIAFPITLKRRGVEQKIVLASASNSRVHRDYALIRGVARAHAWFEELRSGRAAGIPEIARRERLPDTYVQLLLPLAFLAPGIVVAILEGRQPADLTLSRLMKRTTLAVDWPTQRRQLGFAS